MSCTSDQFEHLLACAFIAAHITHHHLEHFCALTGILLKLLHSLHFLLSFAYLHFLKGEISSQRGVSISALVCDLMSPFVNKGEKF
jgi:hypothetical protein